jgi:hypothetical protein
LGACKLILLGGFALESAYGATLALPTRKDKLLLAYLALSGGRPQSRGRLAGLLWGDRGEAQARDSLKQSLSWAASKSTPSSSRGWRPNRHRAPRQSPSTGVISWTASRERALNSTNGCVPNGSASAAWSCAL